jgi:putative DNA methylase
MEENRRLIEDIFPIREIGDECNSERNDEHLSRLHVWWARRPLAVSRSTAFASLIKSKSNNEEQLQFLIKISKANNALDNNFLDETYEKLKNKNLTIIDPFSGGGSIPLEAMRIGCKSIAMDINPVATFLLKCTLEFPHTFQKSSDSNKFRTNKSLVSEIEKWSTWVYDHSKKILEKNYPKEKNGNEIFSYIWARTIDCQNPSCKKEIPLLTNFILKKDSLFLYPEVKNNVLKFRILDLSHEPMPKGFNPRTGTISQSIAICPFCGTTNGTRKKSEKESHISNLFIKKQFREKLLVVVSIDKSKKTSFRIANDNDQEVVKNILKESKNFTKKFENEFNISPIPDEMIWTPNGIEYKKDEPYYNFIFLTTYGFTKWGDLFNPRQKFSLTVLMYYIKLSYAEMIKQGYEEAEAKIILSYLAIIFDKLITRNTSFGIWHIGGSGPEKIFGFAALPMKWFYPEANPILNSGKAFTFLGCTKAVLKVVNHLENIPVKHVPEVKHGSIFEHNFKDKSIDAIFTDPPYYDMMHYSVLSDFFYVWLKRIVGPIFPEIFSTTLTPKSEECISELELIRGKDKAIFKKEHPEVKDSIFYEKTITKIFVEMFRVLKDNGITVIVFAHKSFETWEIILGAILKAQFVVTATWPIETEMKSRTKAQDEATVTSTIYIICRKIKKEPHAKYSFVKQELIKHINEKMDFLWEQKIRGTDFMIALIGSSIEVFGKYDEITDMSDNIIQVKDLLKDVRDIVSDSIIKKIMDNEMISELSNLTRFYVLFRFSFQNKSIPYNDGRLLATSLGVNLEYECNRGFIKKSGKNISCLSYDERDSEKNNDPTEMIDVLHKVLMLWRNGKTDEYENVLNETGYDKSDTFRRVAQAIVLALPEGNAEKRLIERFLNKISSPDESNNDPQTKLF